MQHRLLPAATTSRHLIALLAAAAAALGIALPTAPALADPATSATLTLVTSFGASGGDGAIAIGGLVADKTGAFYGTTTAGGANGLGAVYMLTPPSSPFGAWTKRVIYSFASGNDGRYSYYRLVVDSSGALYGTTYQGGAANAGTVFKLVRPAVGTRAWAETQIYSFRGGNDGSSPGELIIDGKGALYGTVRFGGAAGVGAVYKLSPPPAGATNWTKSVLYSFAGGNDGAEPTGALPMALLCW